MFSASKYYTVYAYTVMMCNELLPLAMLAYTPHAGNPETTNRHLIGWYTSGFE